MIPLSAAVDLLIGGVQILGSWSRKRQPSKRAPRGMRGRYPKGTYRTRKSGLFPTRPSGKRPASTTSSKGLAFQAQP